MKKIEDRKLNTRRKLLGWGDQVATSMTVLSDDQLGDVVGARGPKVSAGLRD